MVNYLFIDFHNSSCCGTHFNPQNPLVAYQWVIKSFLFQIERIKNETYYTRRIEDEEKSARNEEELIQSLSNIGKNIRAFPKEASLDNINKTINSDKSLNDTENKDGVMGNKELESDLSEDNNHFKLGFKDNVKRIFTPFSSYMKSKNVLNDCIYYPPRLLLPITIGILTIVYITYRVFNFALTLESS